MYITINGQNIELEENTTLLDIIKKQDIKTTMYAVELNMKIIPKDKFEETVLNDKDRIEIVHFVGGG